MQTKSAASCGATCRSLGGDNLGPIGSVGREQGLLEWGLQRCSGGKPPRPPASEQGTSGAVGDFRASTPGPAPGFSSQGH